MHDDVAVNEVDHHWEVALRRLDGSWRVIGATPERMEAQQNADQLRAALSAGEEWALELRNVSAGQLRG